ncbi:hypothetical protein AB1Y20_004933 [Prymnesium parvum]|uniref:ODAD1 central coiled coil region domain-containing protein n=1 Tax=Prymnesium parvum TaxID=97485 RepID=A0AB34J528_PRYPA
MSSNESTAALSPDAIAAARQTGLRQLHDRADELSNEIRRSRAQLHALYERQQMFVPSETLAENVDEDAKEVAQLEREVERHEEELWEASLTRKTYELIIKRLRDEGQVFSRDLGIIDHHAKAKEKDATELTLMLKDACDVRDHARTELAKATEKKEERLRQHEAQLHERRRKLKLRHAAAEAHERRCEEMKQMLIDQREEALHRRDTTVDLGSLEAEREQIAQYQAMFEAIKEATGVSHPQEVIEKFNAQESTHALLLSLMRESQQKIDTLKATRAAEGARLMRARFGAEGSAALEVERAPSELEQQAAERADAETRARHRQTRARKANALLVAAESAVAQLTALLAAGEPAEAEGAPVELAEALRRACERIAELGSPPPPEKKPPAEALQRSKTVEALLAAQLPVSGAARRMGRELAEVSLLADDMDLRRLPGPLIQMSSCNYRLQEEEEEESSGEEGEQDEETVLEREALKKQARQVLKRQTKSTRRARNTAKREAGQVVVDDE